MGQEGYLEFFVTKTVDRPQQRLLESLRLVGCDNCPIVISRPEPYDEWDVFQKLVNGEEDPRDSVVHHEDLHMYTILPDKLETTTKDVAIEKVASHWDPEGIVTAHFYGTPLGERIQAVTKRDISESIRGTFNIGSPMITLGWRDIFECAEDEEGHLFGRAFFSFTIMGWSSPNNWKEYRRLIFEIPEIKQLKSDIERIVGPVEQCIYWDV